MKITADVLKKCLPKVKETNAVFAAPHFDKAMEHYGITSPAAVAAFFAQVGHESRSLDFVKESGGDKYLNDMYDTRTDLGNTPGKDSDGARWAGRGYIQVTGYYNYVAASKEFGKSVDELREWLETHAGAAWSAAWFWSKNKLTTIAEKPDTWRGNRNKKWQNLTPFEYITVAVNGGQRGMDDRLERWEKCKKALGI